MEKIISTKQYDLEDRTFKFAQDIRLFVKQLPKIQSNLEDIKQLIRSSGSIAANYIEANEAISKKDFLMRIKIARKEAKESRLWLRLLIVEDPALSRQRDAFVKEAGELMMILSSIMRKSS